MQASELPRAVAAAISTASSLDDADQLPARGALGQLARSHARAGYVETVTGLRTAEIQQTSDGLVLTSQDGHRIDPVDEVVVLTGFRPDLSWLSELRLELDATLQAAVALASLIDPNVHSCGTVYPHGVKELSHSEPNVHLAGMKSYGRPAEAASSGCCGPVGAQPATLSVVVPN